MCRTGETIKKSAVRPTDELIQAETG